jgi:hypothetical protein
MKNDQQSQAFSVQKQRPHGHELLAFCAVRCLCRSKRSSTVMLMFQTKEFDWACTDLVVNATKLAANLISFGGVISLITNVPVTGALVL